MTQFPSYNLSLADKTQLTLTSADTQAASLLALFASATQLNRGNGSGHHLLLSMDGKNLQVDTDDGSVFRFEPGFKQLARSLYLSGLSHIIVQLSPGGFLLHGALAEYNNQGVILIAKGGTGKTTTSNRLPLPWHSLSDDLTLVVHEARGKYWAHPWPTWSRFYKDDNGGSWDVQKKVPLHAIFHLSQAQKDRTEALGEAESVIQLMQSAKQAFITSRNSFNKKFIRKLHMRYLEQFCALPRQVPVLRLHLGLTGLFWNLMEEILVESCLIN